MLTSFSNALFYWWTCDGDHKGREGKKSLSRNRAIPTLPGVSRAHQGEEEKMLLFIYVALC